jgi:ribosome-associated protein
MCLLDSGNVFILQACEAADSKKAQDIKVLDIRDISPITDYFIICSGLSTVQVRAIADEIESKLTEGGCSLHHKEGYNTGRWVLLDFGNFIIHIFHKEDREFYSLERLWADAEVINF